MLKDCNDSAFLIDALILRYVTNLSRSFFHDYDRDLGLLFAVTRAVEDGAKRASISNITQRAENCREHFYLYEEAFLRALDLKYGFSSGNSKIDIAHSSSEFMRKFSRKYQFRNTNYSVQVNGSDVNNNNGVYIQGNASLIDFCSREIVYLFASLNCEFILIEISQDFANSATSIAFSGIHSSGYPGYYDPQAKLNESMVYVKGALKMMEASVQTSEVLDKKIFVKINIS